jgi:hypothetical protein
MALKSFSNTNTALLTLIPRLIVQRRSSSGLTDAIVTAAPNLVNVSVIQVVSISSLPSAIGTNTFFDMFRDVVVDDANLAKLLLLPLLLLLLDVATLLARLADNEIEEGDNDKDEKAWDVDDLPTTSSANVRNRTMDKSVRRKIVLLCCDRGVVDVVVVRKVVKVIRVSAHNTIRGEGKGFPSKSWPNTISLADFHGMNDWRMANNEAEDP